MRGLVLAALTALFAMAEADRVAAQQAPAPASPVTTLPDITALPDTNVIGSTPLLGSDVDRDKVPGETQVLTDHDLSFDGTPDLLSTLGQQAQGVSISNAGGNNFAPNIMYHGFQASPIAGSTQDMAVYVNGVRFNQPFGDVVNWDLLPSIAIDRVDFQGTNPVFGLNALGGAMAVQLKNGFTFQGLDATMLGGSYGRLQGYGEYGAQFGNTAVYAAVDGLYSGGWRQDESSHLNKLYADFGWRGDAAELHINVTAADNELNEPGTVPVQVLDADRGAVFTAPNYLGNKYAQIAANGSYQVNDSTSIQTVAYYQNFIQSVVNGNSPDGYPCGNYLCAAPGQYLTTTGFTPIPNFLNGGPYSQLNVQNTNTNGYGFSVQATNTGTLFGHTNHFTAGASYDGSQNTFTGNTLIGGLAPNDQMSFVGPGITIDQADQSIMPVGLNDTTNYYGLYFLDMFDITPALTLTVAGRFNYGQTDMVGFDPNNGSLSGNHDYAHFNPQVGLTYKINPHITSYADFAESNAMPTPEELSCSDPASPCSLGNFFSGDPNLKQVIAHTIEAGLRGQFTPYGNANFSWNLSAYRTDTMNDIQFIYSPIQGTAYYQNIGDTRRQGVDLGGTLTQGKFEFFANASYINATYLDGLTIPSSDNPGAGPNGNIHVHPGDTLPGIPNWIAKIGFSYNVTDAWQIGATGTYQSGQYLYGDEANLLPTTGAYFVTDLNTSYQLTKHVKLFAQIYNAFNADYYTYGTLSPTSLVSNPVAPDATNPRALMPANPIEAYAGVTVSF